MNIIELFPPGSIPEGDNKTRDYLRKIDSVFEKVLDRAESMYRSTPDNEKGPLIADWKRITGSDSPKEALRRRCDYYKGENLSNTKEHFLKIDKDNTLEFNTNQITVFLKSRIETKIMKSGMRIGQSLRSFKRPEEVINSVWSETKFLPLQLTIFYRA